MSGQVTFSPSQADYVAATRGHYLALIRSRRWLIKIATVLALTVAVATAVIAFIFGYGEVGWFPATMLMAMIFAVATGISINMLWFPRKVRRLFAQQPLYRSEMESAWSDREFSTRSPIGTTVVQWGQFVRWQETSKSFLFYLSDSSYLFVPRRVLDDDQALDLRRCAEPAVARRADEVSP